MLIRPEINAVFLEAVELLLREGAALYMYLHLTQ